MSSESLGKVKLPIEGVCHAWDAHKSIRDHLSENGNVLFQPDTSESVKACCVGYVNDLLRPLLVKMRATAGSPQPCVDPLREELADLYKRYSKKVSEAQVIHDSWVLRKFLGFVKMKCRIKKPSTVTWSKPCKTIYHHIDIYVHVSFLSVDWACLGLPNVYK